MKFSNTLTGSSMKFSNTLTGSSMKFSKTLTGSSMKFSNTLTGSSMKFSKASPFVRFEKLAENLQNYILYVTCTHVIDILLMQQLIEQKYCSVTADAGSASSKERTALYTGVDVRCMCRFG